MPSELLSVAPAVLASAVRPPLNLLTAVIGLGGLGLGGWLVWMGIAFDRPGRAPLTPSRPPTPPAEPRQAPDRRKAVV